MAFLRKGLVGILILFTGCGQTTITQIITLETDTYLSSTDSSSHSTETSLRLSKSATGEERIIVKIPTGSGEPKDRAEDALKDPLALIVAPFLVIVAILADILDCQKSVLQPENLTSAKLLVNVLENGEGTLTNKIGLYLLAKPWWQNASWDYAHYFSSKGRWSSQGGDTDSTFTTSLGSVSGSTLQFDITTYFKNLISAQGTSVHYGLLMKSEAATLAPIILTSAQYSDVTARPRIAATYTGSCVRSSHRPGEERVFILGTPDQPR